MSGEITVPATQKCQEINVILTDSIQQPLGFGLPPHAQEVDRHSGTDDAKADGTLLWSFPEGDDDEEEAGQHKTHWQQNIHLQAEDTRVFKENLKD